jgi:hypothetical protein
MYIYIYIYIYIYSSIIGDCSLFSLRRELMGLVSRKQVVFTCYRS